MRTFYHHNAASALRLAYAQAPSCVGYKLGKGWFVYSPLTPANAATTSPEFFVAAPGTTPVALSEFANEVWISVIKSLRGE